MTLLKQQSNRLNNKGKPFMDYFLCWMHEGHLTSVRVEPSFVKEYRFFYAVAIEVPLGESFLKYVS